MQTRMDMPLWLHLAFTLFFLGLAWFCLRRTRRRSSFALDDRAYMSAEFWRVKGQFAGWISLCLGLRFLYLLWFRNW